VELIPISQLGFEEVLSSPTLITHITYSLYASSHRLRSLVSDLLAAICFVSLPAGHKAVLAAMSDYRVAFDESFRFEELVAFLQLPVTEFGEEVDSSYGMDEEEGVWEARTASMVLINALANCPDLLEDRISLREEFGRRGLNEVIVVSFFFMSVTIACVYNGVSRLSATSALQTRSLLSSMSTRKRSSKMKRICEGALAMP